MKPRPLREALQAAINQRETTLRNGTCKRTDYDQIRVSIGRAQVFLNGYRAASDQRVCEHIRQNLDDLGRILLGTAKGPLMQEYLKALKERHDEQKLKRA